MVKGNFSASNDFDQSRIYIHLSAPSYRPRQAVSGNLVFNLSRQAPAFSLALQFKGIETCKWTDSQNITHRGDKEICNRNYPLQQFKHGLEQGKQAIAFQFTLPNISPIPLPNSMKLDLNQTYAEICYTLRAKVEGAEHLLICDPVKIVIFDKGETVEPSLAHREIVLCSCFMSQGLLRGQLQTKKSQFEPGEKVAVKIMADATRSSLPMEKATVKLIQTLQLRSNQNELNTNVITMLEESVPFGAAKEYRGIIRLETDGMQDALCPSTRSSSIKVQYSVVMDIDVRGAWCWNNLRVEQALEFGPQVSEVTSLIGASMIDVLTKLTFDKFDKRKSGLLNIQYIFPALSHICDQCGFTMPENNSVDKAVRMFDEDRDNLLSFDEFVKLVMMLFKSQISLDNKKP